MPRNEIAKSTVWQHVFLISVLCTCVTHCANVTRWHTSCVIIVPQQERNRPRQTRIAQRRVRRRPTESPSTPLSFRTARIVDKAVEPCVRYFDFYGVQSLPCGIGHVHAIRLGPNIRECRAVHLHLGNRFDFPQVQHRPHSAQRLVQFERRFICRRSRKRPGLRRRTDLPPWFQRAQHDVCRHTPANRKPDVPRSVKDDTPLGMASVDERLCARRCAFPEHDETGLRRRERNAQRTRVCGGGPPFARFRMPRLDMSAPAARPERNRSVKPSAGFGRRDEIPILAVYGTMVPYKSAASFLDVHVAPDLLYRQGHRR